MLAAYLLRGILMTAPIPAEGYPSNTARTDADMQTYFETMLSITKEQLGGTGEATSVELASNTFTPGNNACVCVIDTSGMGPTDTLNTIQISTVVRDGMVIFIRSTNNSRVITIANGAGGIGQVFTGDGNNITLSSTKLFVALKYNASIEAFEEVFRTFGSSSGLSNPMTTLGDTIYGTTGGAPTRLAGNTSTTRNFLRQTGTGSASEAPAWDTLQTGDIPWGSPGAIGETSPNTGTFSSLTLTGSVGAHKWLGNSSGSSSAPSFNSITNADLPSNVVTSSSNLSPLFSSSISSQNLSFSLSDASPGNLFGNFSGSEAPPAFNAPGGTDTFLSVAHSGTGALEYKSITGSTGLSVIASAGNLALANTGVTSLVAGTGISVSSATGAVTISLSTPLSVANGGTGANSLAGNGAVVMNSGGTAATSVAPGASGNVLTSNGTSWVSHASSGGGGNTFPDYVSYTFFGGL
jgi:hypothetical protein